MSAPMIAPYGSWKSPISAAMVARSGMGHSSLLREVHTNASGVYWIAPQPQEGGRHVLMRRLPDGTIENLLSSEFSAKTRVHEYGGGAYMLHHDTVVFTNYNDQRLYRIDPGAAPVPITPEPSSPAAMRFADGRISPDGQWIISVHERHLQDGEVINELVVLPLSGSADPRPVATGRDFYAAPRFSPDGQYLAWICWDHPNMPWDGSELWVAEVSQDGQLIKPRHIAGGEAESIFQPEWDHAGRLYFTSDRSGWWNLYRYSDGEIEPLALVQNDIGAPQWMLGYSRYTILKDGRIACIYDQDGLHHLGLINPEDKTIEPIEAPYSSFYLYALQSDDEGRVWFVGGSFTEEPGIAWLNLDDHSTNLVYQVASLEIDEGFISVGKPINFHSEGGTSHALYYPPANRNFVGKPSERPPLLVFSHGGPTSMARPQLQLEIQYWTSRGIAVVDVNYSGSSGYGRAYRDRLKGEWGILDIADCVNAARYLAGQGEVDGTRLLIRGGSAGGYVTLCALTFYDLFAAGASYYGVADIEMLAKETHKFEAHYMDSLVGPYPEQKRLYHERSPIYFTDRLSCPIILLQGLEDLVVPPSQAEAMAAALDEKGLPYAYITFAGEGHGFSRFETIVKAMQAELYFYSQILNFELAEPLAKIDIVNLDA